MSARPAVRGFGALPLRVVAEIGFALLGIYLLSGGPLWRLWETSNSGSSPDEGNVRLQAVLGALYLTALVITLKRPTAWWRATTSDLSLVALIGWTMVSVIWSQAPDVTLVRAVALLGTSFFGIYFAVRYSLESQLRLLGFGIGLVVLYNAYLAFTSPAAIGDGNFAGVYDHKNSLGKMMALATVTFVCLARERRGRGLAIAGACASFVMLVVSGSATGLVVALTLVGVLPLLSLLKGDIRLLGVLAIAGLLVLGTGILLGSQFLAIAAPVLGRDITLTGRTELWPVLVTMIVQRPWLGYGYSAFWSHDESGLGISWRPTQAHNGFLEVALALGLIGLVIFCFVLVRGLARALGFLRGQGTPASAWPLMYFVFILLYNITEATALGRNSILWVLFVAGLVNVSPAWRGTGRGAGVFRRRPRPPAVLVPTPGTLGRSARPRGVP